MSESKNDEKLSAFNSIVSLLSKLDEEDQKHIVDSVINWFGLSNFRNQLSNIIKENDEHQSLSSGIGFSTTNDISPKDFLLEKAPQSNVERVACLAYYLTHYRDTPHFKTFDISKLNTEAAQPKFSNPTVAVNDASKAGLLVPSGKGSKQLSALGEQFVLALPNRDDAKSVLKKMKPKRRKKKAHSKKDLS